MDHFIDIYNKKKYGAYYCESLLKLDGIKINLKVDGKPFQVLYNEKTNELEWHGRSGNETTIGPLIDDYTRLFSKPINDAIAHIEPRKNVFKKYKFLTFEVIDNTLLLTAIIDKNDNFINDADEIKNIAKQLDTDVMPTLWEGKLSNEQITAIMDILSTGVVPEKQNLINWVKSMFGTYKSFPNKLISANDEYIEGIVFFFDYNNKIIEYKIVDPTYRKFMKDRNNDKSNKRNEKAEIYEQIYNLFVNYLLKNAESLDNNYVVSMQKNFVNICNDKKLYDKFNDLGNQIETNTSKTYGVQVERTLPEVQSLIKKQSIKNVFELFMKTFYKEKKRSFIISKEFQDNINAIIKKMKSVNESYKSLKEYVYEKLNEEINIK